MPRDSGVCDVLNRHAGLASCDQVGEFAQPSAIGGLLVEREQEVATPGWAENTMRDARGEMDRCLGVGALFEGR